MRLFEDVFTVKAKDPKGRKFERVSRIVCEAFMTGFELILDLNTQLYPMELDEQFSLCLARSLDDEAAPSSGTYVQNRESSLADSFDYVMHGTIYRVEEKEGQVAVYASYGGMLMRLKGNRSALMKPGLELDSSLYLLIRK
ncbi:RNA polymerase subunit [Salpingoeca rosetta]|uniref:DNA-directed RNA polymerases I, II, and III subunit RPABC3 n=1 Tax=Salpingoeca rosetta (strain ATCC 50818 / BSB-021) TaxID=946362 RepID=F2U160_SALR5|nr:RNA polymerase subunit [Salpingoeca rosetta]EGD80634.1 RNA polymerase subunit [Salpingoeca rosetta]|eukprot:XP_004997195.1 RNA polymerase subunit [Salpingoeca rosetta]